MGERSGARRPSRETGEREEPLAQPRPWRPFGVPLDPGRAPASRLVRYGGTLGALALAMAALWPVRQDIGLLNIGLVFLVVVIGATVLAGRNAGILASVLGFALFDFFLVPPYLTFAVNELHNILALFVFLGVSALLSWLIAGAREQAQQATRRAEDMARLYELNQAIIGAQHVDQVLPAIAGRVAEVFDAQACWILLPDKQQQLAVVAQAPGAARAPTRDEVALARWAFTHGTEVGRSGEAVRQAQVPERAAFLPLRAAGGIIGVLAVADKSDRRPFSRAEHTVLATFAGQAAAALERLQLLREAQRAEMLARTDELKSALVSAVSHDLRTPLASIIASVTTLLEPDVAWDADTRREFLQSIDEEARRLNRLVGNLLDMSRIESGVLRPEKDWYAVGEVIEATAQRLEPRLAGHHLTLDIAPDLPLIRFDFVQIEQVLTNLLENALKYTPPGTAIAVQARRTADTVEISVTDDGPGVSQEQRARLFERFYRVDGRARPKGMGLGLAISKGLVEAHDGRIWVVQPPGSGLRITFTLPITSTETGTVPLEAPVPVGA